jgi:crossover junction endodeoxyribonuclease RusA
VAGRVIELTLPEPPSANRYWRTFRGRAVKSAEARAYRQLVAVLATTHRLEPLRGDLDVTLTWYRQARRGDLDNRAKAILDALNGLAWGDDRQIRRLLLERVDGEPPARVVVRVRRWGGTAPRTSPAGINAKPVALPVKRALQSGNDHGDERCTD